jgi:hypothetical protein
MIPSSAQCGKLWPCLDEPLPSIEEGEEKPEEVGETRGEEKWKEILLWFESREIRMGNPEELKDKLFRRRRHTVNQQLARDEAANSSRLVDRIRKKTSLMELSTLVSLA